MAMRSVVSRNQVRRLMDSSGRPTAVSGLRYFADDKGRVLSEEERAAENIYIQKMEREKQEKLKKKAEKEKAEKQKTEKAGSRAAIQDGCKMAKFTYESTRENKKHANGCNLCDSVKADLDIFPNMPLIERRLYLVLSQRTRKKGQERYKLRQPLMRKCWSWPTK